MQHIQKSILVFKPDYLESNGDSNAALSLFNRDARMHICKCKQDENRNKILRNRLFIRKQLQSNPHLEDIVRRYDEYYEEFKNKMVMQIGALERLLKYLKDLEASNHKTHHHHHHHYHHHHHHHHRQKLCTKLIKAQFAVLLICSPSNNSRQLCTPCSGEIVYTTVSFSP